MTRARIAAPMAAAALLLSLAGCSAEDQPTTASPATSSAAAPATSASTASAAISDEATIRQVCNELVALGNDFNFDPAANLAAARRAELIADPAFSRAGRELVKVASAAAAAPGPDTNLGISQTRRAFLDVCGDNYGDGPW
ncbi:hypothetical protein O7600_20130 [Micromonospora sp. WMMA1998]|uniref:hypothetical protein n=1 Tax=Micromonospora sp. WMMA1998 TaxID=3015167 RepID=UPI00248AB916|nr:hypothetical protein [Micromonospora sp. WMMA1998]WBC13440.1 hypothetical protein O7600_20130 [Micromonospora sp. WMMA1998]